MEILIILAVIAAPVLLGIVLYNRFVALKQTRHNAFADIDVQLQQRYDLIPNLIETVKGYAKHEQETLQNVTNARARVGKASGEGERLAAEGALSGALLNLFAVAENYPDLKADQNFRELQAELSDIENKIAAARRFFNNATSEYNTAIQQFPGNIVAGMTNFAEEPFFEIGEEERDALTKPPEVKFDDYGL